MGTRLSVPGPQARRFAAYIEGLATAAGHEDRHEPLKNYCKALLLPGERKSIEPMAARLDPENIQSMRQCLHHAADVGEITARDRVPLAPDAGYAAHGPLVDLGWFRDLREAIGTK